MDEIGPLKIIQVFDRKTNLEGILVLDNLKLGPGKGGIRMDYSVSIEEIFRLARIMTLKNALAGLPFGGAKAGIKSNPKKLKTNQRKRIIQKFAELIKEYCPKFYIAGPDAGTNQLDMKWFAEAIGKWEACTGKPKSFCKGKKCGLPHEIGTTGYGIALATKIAAEHLDLEKTVAIEGFGNVGKSVAFYLEKFGFNIVAVSDSKGCVYEKNGLNIDKLLKIKEKTGSVINYGKKYSCSYLFKTKCDILIPSALSDSINRKTARFIKAKLIVEGANIPTTEDGERILRNRKIRILPDFLVNAGGVITSYCELKGYGEKKAFELVEKIISKNVRKVLKATDHDYRKVAIEFAKKRLGV